MKIICVIIQKENTVIFYNKRKGEFLAKYILGFLFASKKRKNSQI